MNKIAQDMIGYAAGFAIGASIGVSTNNLALGIGLELHLARLWAQQK